jgi:hypothetical protein
MVLRLRGTHVFGRTRLVSPWLGLSRRCSARTRHAQCCIYGYCSVIPSGSYFAFRIASADSIRAAPHCSRSAVRSPSAGSRALISKSRSESVRSALPEVGPSIARRMAKIVPARGEDIAGEHGTQPPIVRWCLRGSPLPLRLRRGVGPAAQGRGLIIAVVSSSQTRPATFFAQIFST